MKTEHIFERKIYAEMLTWKEENHGRSALLIEGARRIGKSTIVELFAKREYESYILIDFNKASQEVRSLFDDLMNLDYIFLRLQQIYHTPLAERKSVIVFDEVQKCPLARQAIKYLVEDRRYDYIETGSLISIKKNTENITIPSEEDRLEMFPLDYEEFRWALGDKATMPILRQFWNQRLPLKAAHRQSMRDFRLYMLVGGMPQAVSEYLETNNLQKVDAVKRKIIALYEDDFLKIDKTGKLGKLFRSIPAQLSKNANRFQPTAVVKGIDADSMTELLLCLEDSKTVNICFHADDPNVGMSLETDTSRFKMYTGDTGLMVTLAFWDKKYIENIIYDKLLSDKLDVNLGYIYENVVAQMLRAKGHKLFYYTFPKDEKHNYEVDFLLSHGAKLWPLEVKSSGYRTHASLDAFCAKYSSRIDKRFLVYTKDYARDEMTIMLPTYMVPVME